ncbi:MAG: permease, partial [Chloroflexota bacterium]
MNDIIEIARFVVEAVLQVWPLFLISIFFSVLIRALKLDGVIRRAFNANVGTAILLATLVGAFSPFCSCTVVPVIAGLLLSGVPLAPIMAFWIASPTMDPEIFTLSVGVLGWPLAITRLVATLVLSLAAGFLTLALTNTAWLAQVLPGREKRAVAASAASPTLVTPAVGTTTSAEATASFSIPLTMTTDSSPVTQPADQNPAAFAAAAAPSCSTCVNVAPQRDPRWYSALLASWRQIQWPEFGREVGKQSWLLGRWLLLAFLMEALITQYIPQDMIAGVLGEGNIFAIPLAALIGVPLYLSNFTALPIVSGLLDQGMLPGAAIAFLIAGPVTTIPAMTAVYGIVHRRLFA